MARRRSAAAEGCRRCGNPRRRRQSGRRPARRGGGRDRRDHDPVGSAAQGEGGPLGSDRAAGLLQAGAGRNDGSHLRGGSRGRPPRPARQSPPWRQVRARDRRPSRDGERRDARSPQPSTGDSPVAGGRRPERPARPAGGPSGAASRADSSRADSSRADSSRAAQSRPGSSGEPRRSGVQSTSRRPGTPAGEASRTDARRPSAARSTQAEAPPRRVAPRFEPGTAHRDALFASLAPEQRPIAERLGAGGIPAVRRAVAEERERARSEGRPEASGEAILALAEQLAPPVKQAIWLDRAEAAVAQFDRISLRDLRATVVAAAPRDEVARELDRKLREELDRRVTRLRSNWEEQIVHSLEEGRVLQALRLSAQPPEPTAASRPPSSSGSRRERARR